MSRVGQALQRVLRRDDGTAALEFVLIAPALLLLLALVMAYGRKTGLDGQVDAAARDAARAATLAGSYQEAQQAANAVVEQALRNRGCAPQGLVQVGGGLSPEASFTEDGTLDVTVTCRYSVSDLGLPFMPGSLTASSTFSSHLDPYRGYRATAGGQP